jgi:hypothetical protein
MVAMSGNGATARFSPSVAVSVAAHCTLNLAAHPNSIEVAVHACAPLT